MGQQVSESRTGLSFCAEIVTGKRRSSSEGGKCQERTSMADMGSNIFHTFYNGHPTTADITNWITLKKGTLGDSFIPPQTATLCLMGKNNAKGRVKGVRKARTTDDTKGVIRSFRASNIHDLGFQTIENLENRSFYRCLWLNIQKGSWPPDWACENAAFFPWKSRKISGIENFNRSK